MVLEGFHALKHAIRFGAKIEKAVVKDEQQLKTLIEKLAPDLEDTPHFLIEAQVFDQLSPVPHPTGVLAIAQRPTGIKAQVGSGHIVVLDNPQRLSNIGASIRVAAAANAAGLIVIGEKDPWSPEAVRGAAGLQFALPVMRLDQLPESFKPIVAVDPEGEEGADIPKNAVFVFGSERSGISQDILDRAGIKLRLPMKKGVSSLNLATSVAAVLYSRNSQ